mgnify:CR=1 FL=1
MWILRYGGHIADIFHRAAGASPRVFVSLPVEIKVDTRSESFLDRSALFVEALYFKGTGTRCVQFAICTVITRVAFLQRDFQTSIYTFSRVLDAEKKLLMFQSWETY